MMGVMSAQATFWAHVVGDADFKYIQEPPGKGRNGRCPPTVATEVVTLWKPHSMRPHIDSIRQICQSLQGNSDWLDGLTSNTIRHYL